MIINRKFSKKTITLLMAAITVFTVSCSFSEPAGNSVIDASGSFAEAHDAFTTTLEKEENDNEPIPEPPEGVFDLVSYPSKVGDLAAYVSSDPGDGEKHPMIIWAVGGWGNGIDDFPFTYPQWDNDQTGSAFWQNGILTMYPSFRGGNGNPGYDETLFGEVDDIVSAYEYAASLPYVDSDRIYLGGHSIGGTRALLASEYTDKFRAVFCFGPVDKIKYYNNSQFTFDTGNKDEYVMRSPIYWLEDVKSPTFLIEGRVGNSKNLERMEKASQNENIHFYVVKGADHFSVLAPATRIVAQKILEDTGDEASIVITPKELEDAMSQEIPVPEPVMTERRMEEIGLTFSCPYLWEMEDDEEGNGVYVYSPYEAPNPWDMSLLCITAYSSENANYLQNLREDMENQEYMVNEISVDGKPAVESLTMLQDSDGDLYYQRCVSVQNGTDYVDFDFLIYEDYMEEADILFQRIIDSITFDD